ncbi:MAG: hypothetical protein U0610_29700 [bacterium]
MKRWLSAEEQWRRTAEFAEDYARTVQRVLADAPPNPTEGHAHISDWLWYFRDLARRWESDPHAPPFDRLGGFRDLELFQDCTWTFDDPWEIGVIRARSRLFAAGDVVLVAITNGQARHPVWAVSSRGYRVRGLFLDTDRLGQAGRVRLLGSQGGLAGLRPSDPATQRLVADLRAGWAAAT